MNARSILIATSVALGGLVPLAATAMAQIGDDAFDAPAWSRLLGVQDLGAREREYGRLVDEARESASARATLHEWAQGDDDLAWTSRLALRELELREQLEGRAPGRRTFGRIPFDMEPFADLLDRGFMGHDSFGGDPFSGLGVAPGDDSQSRSESFQMESTPDGVKIEVREEKDGQEQVKTYEGKTLEEILEANPDLREHINVAPTLDLHGFDDFFGRLRPFQTPPDVFGGRMFGSVPTDRLGVLVREPGSYEVPAGVEPDKGLLVERVLPGTLAAALGIHPGDVVVSLNGEPVGSAEDVRAVLSKLEPGGEVTAEVVEGDGTKHTLHYEPESLPVARGPRRDQV